MWPQRPWSRRVRLRERGAVALTLALIVAFVILPLSALAVDIGQQRVARRDVQAVADTVALDMARTLNASGASAVTDAVAQTSAANDAGTVGAAPSVTVKVGYIDPSATWTSDQGLGCNGTYSNSYFTYPVPSSVTGNAVLVVARGSVSFGLGRIAGVTAGPVCRSAIADAASTACFRLGSYAAAIKSGNAAVLGPLLGSLGSGIDTTAVGYQGLANTQLNLGNLQAALGAGTPTQLLGTSVTLGAFYLAVVQALTAQGDAADATVVSTLKADLGTSAANTVIPVSSLMGLSLGTGSAASLTLNALDLVAGAAEIANGGSFVSIPGLSVALPGVTSASASLQVIEPAQLACGLPNQATATTAQVKLAVTASVLSALPSVLGLSVSAGPITVAVQTAQGQGVLTGISCSTAPQSMSVSVANSLLPATITIPLTVSAPLLGSMTLSAVVTTVPTNPASQSVTLTVPTNVTTGVATGGSGVSNLNLTSATSVVTASGSTGLLGLLGVSLASLTTALTSGPIATIESGVVTPLLTSITSLLESDLGLSLAGSDAFADSINCGSPQLVG